MDKHHHHHHHAMSNTSSLPNSMMSSTTVSSLFEAVITTAMSTGLHHNNHNGSDTSHDIALSDSHHSMDSGHSHHSTLGPNPGGDHSQHLGSLPGADHMLMYFYSGVDTVILFKEWNTSTAQGLFGSVVVIFLMAMMYEGIKFFREYMFKKYFTSLEYTSVSVLGDDGKTVTEVHKVARNRMFSWPHTIQTILHVLQMILSYFLMLIFMTYNVWLCLGVVLGAGTGYFMFGWKKATVVDITEHCH